MRFDQKNPPRRYQVGNAAKFDISDCGSLHLDPDEQVTFVTDSGKELDVTRKSWGFYATPSVNGRLLEFGLRAVLVYNKRTGRYFILLVEKDRVDSFQKYIDEEGLDLVSWLDTTEVLDKARLVLMSKSPR